MGRQRGRGSGFGWFAAGLTLAILAACTPSPPLSVTSGSDEPSATTTASAALTTADLGPYTFEVESGDVRRLALLRTVIPQRPRFQVIEYTVQLGDTAWSIGEQFGLRPETILWGNPWLSVEAGNLSIGIGLKIAPVDGVLHEVREGDTVESIASIYGVTPEDIREFPGNGIAAEGSAPEVGQELIVPGGIRTLAWSEPGPAIVAGLGRRSPGLYSGPLVETGNGYFLWPVNTRNITQGYWDGHPAIDIDTYFRQPVFASDSGTAIFSGWSSTGYGNLVILDHANGFWTYYAHNEANLISVGQGVSQGQQIAESGSTGNSTGYHLHFGIRLDSGSFLNPLNFLP
ncbi:MAG: peptidoglycan DD-metalloendopeptidase family protein [Anaerolineales bacterium]